MAHQSPDVSVVIPTFNRRATVASTLCALSRQDLPASRMEIIVVDDGSRDGTFEHLSALRFDCGLRVLRREHAGPTAARNDGWQAARAPLILFLDDDLECSPSVLRTHLMAHAGGPRRIAIGPIEMSANSPEALSAQVVKMRSEAVPPTAGGAVLPRPCYVGANTSIPLALLRESGGFDPAFAFQREDVELGVRLWKAGAEFQLVDAVAFQVYTKPPEELVRANGEVRGRFEVRLCVKHEDYRPVSGFAWLLGNSTAKRLAWRIAAGAPFSWDPMLRVAFQVAQRFQKHPFFFRVAAFLLGKRIAAAFLRSARLEAGSWRALMALSGATPMRSVSQT